MRTRIPRNASNDKRSKTKFNKISKNKLQAKSNKNGRDASVACVDKKCSKDPKNVCKLGIEDTINSRSIDKKLKTKCPANKKTNKKHDSDGDEPVSKMKMSKTNQIVTVPQSKMNGKKIAKSKKKKELNIEENVTEHEQNVSGSQHLPEIKRKKRKRQPDIQISDKRENNIEDVCSSVKQAKHLKTERKLSKRKQNKVWIVNKHVDDSDSSSVTIPKASNSSGVVTKVQSKVKSKHQVILKAKKCVNKLRIDSQSFCDDDLNKADLSLNNGRKKLSKSKGKITKRKLEIHPRKALLKTKKKDHQQMMSYDDQSVLSDVKSVVTVDASTLDIFPGTSQPRLSRSGFNDESPITKSQIINKWEKFAEKTRMKGSSATLSKSESGDVDDTLSPLKPCESDAGLEDHQEGSGPKIEDHQEGSGPESGVQSEASPFMLRALENELQDDKRIACWKCEGGAYLVLVHPQQVCLQGLANVEVIDGSVQVLQHYIEEGDGPQSLYSPNSHSLLLMKSSRGVDPSWLTSTYKELPLNDLDIQVDDSLVLLKVTPLLSNEMSYFKNLPRFSRLFQCFIGSGKKYNAPLRSIGLAVSPPAQVPLSVLRMTSDHLDAVYSWLSLINDEKDVPVVLVCAGQNCGKSTLSRLLVNIALSVKKTVCYLDCDLGQSELTPSGCVSLHLLTKPFFGPPFTHQQQPERMCFFGDSSPKINPDLYVKQLNHLYTYYKQHCRHMPLVINTMGWSEGLGICLMIDTVRLTSPSMIIQIDCCREVRNFQPMTVEYVKQEPGWLYSSKQVAPPHHKLVRFMMDVDPLKVMHLSWKAPELRFMALVAYLSRPVPVGGSLHDLVPQAVSWNTVGIHVCNRPVKHSKILFAINASFVALCQADLSQAHRENEEWPWVFDSPPICQCLGFGIIRGVDMNSKQLLVVTPMSKEQLQHVNTILKGNNSIEGVFHNKKSETRCPYMDTMVGSHSTGSVNIRRIPRR